MKTCTICKESKPLEEFYKAARRKDGLTPQCKICGSAMTKASRMKKPAEALAQRKAYAASQTALAAKWKSERGCVNCGETFAGCLELHHLDPNEKEGNPANLARASFAAFLKEAVKCVILCSNCHKKALAGVIEWSGSSVGRAAH